jgi:hypothetical protein
MNPGLSEEAGKTARSVVDALKSEPLSLALVVMNVLLLALFFYVIKTSTDVRHRDADRMLEMSKLLANCK